MLWYQSYRVLLRSFIPRTAPGIRTLASKMAGKLEIFQGIGLSEQKAKETIKNDKLAQRLESIINQVINLGL